MMPLACKPGATAAWCIGIAHGTEVHGRSCWLSTVLSVSLAIAAAECAWMQVPGSAVQVVQGGPKSKPMPNIISLMILY